MTFAFPNTRQMEALVWCKLFEGLSMYVPCFGYRNAGNSIRNMQRISERPVLLEKNKAQALKQALGDKLPDIRLGDQKEDHDDFMLLCKKGCIVPSTKVEPVRKDDYLKPLVFHDGRLVHRSTFLCSIFLLYVYELLRH